MKTIPIIYIIVLLISILSPSVNAQQIEKSQDDSASFTTVKEKSFIERDSKDFKRDRFVQVASN